MPFPNEHAARLRDPDAFVSIAQLWARQGIRALGGRLKSDPRGGSEIQTLRFSASRYTPEQARKWLGDHGYKPILFEPASGGKGMDMGNRMLELTIVRRLMEALPDVTELPADVVERIGSISDDEQRTLWTVITTDAKDRAGDIVRPAGLDFENYKQNPVVLWCHSFDKLPVAKVLELVQQEHFAAAKVQFADTEMGRDLYTMYKTGFLTAWSISFIPKRYVWLEPPAPEQVAPVTPSRPVGPASPAPEAGSPAPPRQRVIVREVYGRDIMEGEVLELSAVPVPANPAARTLTVGKSQDAPLDAETAGFLEELLVTEDARALVKGIVSPNMAYDPDAEFRGACPFRSYTLAPEGEAWDAAEQTNAASPAELRVMCGWYDSEKPDLKTSYKLPHHRRADKHTVWRAVAASMAALMGGRGGADIPAKDRRAVYNHLARHYAEFKKEPPEFKSFENMAGSFRINPHGKCQSWNSESCGWEDCEPPMFKNGAFHKTVSERGESGKIPCIIQEGLPLEFTLDIIPIQRDNEGVITEAKIVSVGVTLPGGAPATEDRPAPGAPAPTPTPSKEAGHVPDPSSPPARPELQPHRVLFEVECVTARAVQALAEAADFMAQE